MESLLELPEQVEDERIRPAVVFGSPMAERSRHTGTPGTTLRYRIVSFGAESVRSLFEMGEAGAEGRGTLDPEIRGFIPNPEAEYLPMRDNEIATVRYVRFGKRPHGEAGARNRPYGHQDVQALHARAKRRVRRRPAR